jgi:hypothetical protein
MQFRESRYAIILVATLLVVNVGCAQSDQSAHKEVMLILRGISSSEEPRGQLDDQSALEYARRVGFHGEVLDVAADTSGNNAQVPQALERIRRGEYHRTLRVFGWRLQCSFNLGRIERT